MGYDDAFGTIHDRYRQRLLAYTRQMLGPSRSDAEDVLQDVFLRAYGALRNDDRPVTLRAWLYRVAHNRCIDHLRRPLPPAAEIYELSRTPAHDPQAETVRREDLRRLVQDVQRLPEQQRSALLMRELDGLTYAELADALDTSVPAIKSLLVRARVGLVEAEEARDAACVRHPRRPRPRPRARRADQRALAPAPARLRRLPRVPPGRCAASTRASRRSCRAAPGRSPPWPSCWASAAPPRAPRPAPAPGPAARPPWPAAPRPPRPPRRRSSRSSAAPPSSAEARPRCASRSARRRPRSHAARHVRKAASHAAAAAVAPRQGAGRARDRPGARRRPARGGRPQAPEPPTTVVTTPARRRATRATGSVAAPAAPAAPVAAATPEEAQTGGAMAPDEDAMPGPDGDRRRRRSLTRPTRAPRPSRRARRRRRPATGTGRERRCAGRRGCPDHRGHAGGLTAFGRTGAIVARRRWSAT